LFFAWVTSLAKSPKRSAEQMVSLYRLLLYGDSNCGDVPIQKQNSEWERSRS